MNSKDFFGGFAVLTLGVGLAAAQEATPVVPPPSATPAPASKVAERAAAPVAPPSGALATGPAVIPPHWSKNKYPADIPEGAIYYIVVKGDTLWDIATRFLGSPYLWPQVWDQNKYITDAHWIYPGDPVILPKVSVVSDSAGARGTGTEGMGEETSETTTGTGTSEGRSVGSEVRLTALTEENTLQCAEYIANPSDDTSFKIVSNEEGDNKVAFATRDVVYLNRGSNAGVKAGDRFMVHREEDSVLHPLTKKHLGTRVLSPGWIQVVLVREKASIAVVEESCSFIQVGDYLLPFERVNVPLVSPKAPSTRLSSPSGKLVRHIVEVADRAVSAGTGQLVHLDAGSRDGLTPGAQLVVFRIIEPGIPTPRAVLAEIAVVSVRETTSVAKVVYSTDALYAGYEVELR